MAGLEPHDAQVVGITGSPGVGKSTLTSALIAALRGSGRTVAVLAIDPSSPFTGGAVLGDRIRMQDHVMDDGVFIRSAATRGHLADSHLLRTRRLFCLKELASTWSCSRP